MTTTLTAIDHAPCRANVRQQPTTRDVSGLRRIPQPCSTVVMARDSRVCSLLNGGHET